MNEPTTLEAGHVVKSRKIRNVLGKAALKQMLKDAKAGMTTNELCEKYNVVSTTVLRRCHENGISVTRGFFRSSQKRMMMKMIKSGLDWIDAARKCGVPRQTAYYWIRGLGIGRKHHFTTEGEIETLISAVNDGKPLLEAAKLAGITVSTASRICKRMGVSVKRIAKRSGALSANAIGIIRLAQMGFSRKYIVAKTGLSYSTVSSTLSRHGISDCMRDEMIDSAIEKCISEEPPSGNK